MPDRGEAAGFAGAFEDSRRSRSQEHSGSRWANRGKLRTLSLFGPSDARDGDDSGQKVWSAGGSPSPATSEGVGLRRRDGRAFEAGAGWKGLASSPTVLCAEMASAEWRQYSESPPPSSAPVTEGLPFQGFMVARRRVCRLSEKKETAGTREESIAYRAQWATHSFLNLRREEMDSPPPPAIGGVSRMLVRGFTSLDGLQDRRHGDPAGCSRGGGEEALKMTMNSAHLETSVSRGTDSMAFCSPEARKEEEGSSAGSRSSPPQSQFQRARSSSPPGLISPRPNEKVLVEVEQGRERQSALDLQVEAASGDRGSMSLDVDAGVDLSAPASSVDSAARRRPSSMGMGGVSVELAASDKPEKSKSVHPSCQVEDHPDADQEERSRWVKRLKVVRSDGHSVEGGDSSGGALACRREQRLCSRVMNYSRSNPFTLAKCLQERRQLQKTMLLLRSSDSLAAPPVDSLPWIRRWSRNSRLTPPPPGQEAETAEPLSENLQGSPFPSLAAMALVGKAMTNFRPCKFQRRGSSLVWNLEGL